MKKHLIILSSLALSSSLFVFTPNASAAKSSVQQEQSQEMASITVSTKYDQNGLQISQTTVTDGDITKSVLGVTTIPSVTSPSIISPYVVENEGSMNYKLIDTYNGSSKIVDSLKEWTAQFASMIIPAKLVKNVWAASAGGATFNTFHSPPSTRYYTTKVYQASDSWYYYGRTIAYEYSDSSRTKLTNTVEHINRIPK